MKTMKVKKMQTKDLEFHYVVSYREGEGWQIAVDVEDAVMTDGTIYHWNNDGTGGWFFAYEDSPEDENASIADLDTSHYSMLKSALHLLNQGVITNA